MDGAEKNMPGDSNQKKVFIQRHLLWEQIK